MRRRTLLAGTAALAVLLAFPAQAAEFEVQMLNRGEAGPMVFEPVLTRVAVGDTVKFLPTNPSHNAETIPGILPEGAESFRGGINKEISITFDVPGIYGIKCLPHFGMGMVALVVVGDAPYANLDAAKTVKVPPNARKRLDAALTELDAAH
jgi:pseudoazurin